MALGFTTPEDTPHLTSIYAPCILNTCITCEYTVPSVEEFAKRVHSISSKIPCLVYESDGIVLGYTYAAPHMTQVVYQWDAEFSIYMDEQHHRGETGTMLYKTLTVLLREQRYHNLYALISIPNNRGIDFHHSLGFEQVGVYPHIGYKLGRWNDLTILKYCTQPQLEHSAPTRSILDLPKNRIEGVFESMQRVPRISR